MPDRLLIDGIEYKLLTFPTFPTIQAPKGQTIPRFYGTTSSNCWRMYVATWEVKDDRLWLIDVAGTLLTKPATAGEIERYYIDRFGPNAPPYDPKKHGTLISLILNAEKGRSEPATLQLLFPGLVLNGRVFADWYTGSLHIEKIHNSSNSATKRRKMMAYPKDFYFQVINGMVKKQANSSPR